jgi:hypothetical protein
VQKHAARTLKRVMREPLGDLQTLNAEFDTE